MTTRAEFSMTDTRPGDGAGNRILASGEPLIGLAEAGRPTGRPVRTPQPSPAGSTAASCGTAGG